MRCVAAWSFQSHHLFWARLLTELLSAHVEALLPVSGLLSQVSPCRKARLTSVCGDKVNQASPALLAKQENSRMWRWVIQTWERWTVSSNISLLLLTCRITTASNSLTEAQLSGGHNLVDTSPTEGSEIPVSQGSPAERSPGGQTCAPVSCASQSHSEEQPWCAGRQRGQDTFHILLQPAGTATDSEVQSIPQFHLSAPQCSCSFLGGLCSVCWAWETCPPDQQV